MQSLFLSWLILFLKRQKALNDKVVFDSYIKQLKLEGVLTMRKIKEYLFENQQLDDYVSFTLHNEYEKLVPTVMHW